MVFTPAVLKDLTEKKNIAIQLYLPLHTRFFKFDQRQHITCTAIRDTAVPAAAHPFF